MILFYFQTHSSYTLLSVMAVVATNPRSRKKDGYYSAEIAAREWACLCQFFSLSYFRCYDKDQERNLRFEISDLF